MFVGAHAGRIVKGQGSDEKEAVAVLKEQIETIFTEKKLEVNILMYGYDENVHFLSNPIGYFSFHLHVGYRDTTENIRISFAVNFCKLYTAVLHAGRSGNSKVYNLRRCNVQGLYTEVEES